MLSILNLNLLALAIVFIIAYTPLEDDSRHEEAKQVVTLRESLNNPKEQLTEPLVINQPTLTLESGGDYFKEREHSDRIQHNATSKGLSYSVRNTLYDVSIKKWSSVYTPDYPWCWNKAQIKAESAFNTDAVSRVGAMGLGQFMPATWSQMQRELGFSVSAFSPNENIQAQAYYMSKLRANFKHPRPERDKHSLAMASYNAGLGNILKAQKLAHGSYLYNPMIEQLPKVTGSANARETRTYVNRIWAYVREYETEGICD